VKKLRVTVAAQEWCGVCEIKIGNDERKKVKVQKDEQNGQKIRL
jgi:hypothetical protein